MDEGGEDLILTTKELRKILQTQCQTGDQTVWLTTSQAGFPTTILRCFPTILPVFPVPFLSRFRSVRSRFLPCGMFHLLVSLFIVFGV